MSGTHRPAKTVLVERPTIGGARRPMKFGGRNSWPAALLLLSVIRMAEAETLTAEQAESVVDELIERFGPGAYPKVTVTEIVPGTWRIRWRSMDVEAPAMGAETWRDWLRERVGSIAPERLETSEG